MTNKNLLIFSYDFPPSNGGIARLCNEIAQGAMSEYDDVIILTIKKDGPQIPYNNQKLKIKYLPSKRIFSELAALRFLLTLKNRKNYQVLCGIWHPEALLIWLAGYNKINVLAHGAELLAGNSKFRKQFWLGIYAKWILSKVTIIANSNFTASLCKNIAPKAKITALPLAVNHHFFKQLEKTDIKKIVFGTVSRIEQFKGHDFILKVLSKLPKKYIAQIEWHIAGTGPYLEELKQDVNKLNLESVVKFSGFILDNELPGFYNSLNVFILCTRHTSDSNDVEGFGLVFLEAQACGLPVIGTNSGGIPSAIKQNNGGWLIEQDNEQELSELIKMLINDMLIFKEQGLKARKRVEEECTWELYCQKLFKILD